MFEITKSHQEEAVIPSGQENRLVEMRQLCHQVEEIVSSGRGFCVVELRKLFCRNEALFAPVSGSNNTSYQFGINGSLRKKQGNDSTEYYLLMLLTK